MAYRSIGVRTFVNGVTYYHGTAVVGTVSDDPSLSRLDETARFLESRIESYNVHAHSTRLLRCSEVNEGCYSEVI